MVTKTKTQIKYIFQFTKVFVEQYRSYQYLFVRYKIKTYLFDRWRR